MEIVFEYSTRSSGSNVSTPKQANAREALSPPHVSKILNLNLTSSNFEVKNVYRAGTKTKCEHLWKPLKWTSFGLTRQNII